VLRREFKGRLLGRHSEKQELGTARPPYGRGSVEINLRLKLDVICIELNTLTLALQVGEELRGISDGVPSQNLIHSRNIGEALTGYVHPRSWLYKIEQPGTSKGP
jgi:hypothetical protein